MPDKDPFSIPKFIRSLTIYTVVIVVLSYTLRHGFEQVALTPAYLFIILLMFAITTTILWLLGKSMDGKLSRFTNAFMLLNFGKLFLYTVIIFVYAYLNREDAIPFIISFFVYYLLFTGFEIYVLLKINRKKGSVTGSSAGHDPENR